MPRRIILKTQLSPGDLCTLTAAIESLHWSYPGQFLTDVRTTCDAIFQHNPHVTPLPDHKAQTIEMHYTDLVSCCDRVPNPFLRGYCQDLGKNLGIALELQTSRPHLYVSEQEKTTRPIFGGVELPEDYWLVSAGVKSDFTLKQWPVEYYQEVIDHFRRKVQFVEVGAAEHDHPKLNGVLDLVGRTDARQLICLAYHAVGGLGPITFLQHLCAAFEKPYVALLGGREPVSWVQYPLQTTLHTLGKLPCCRTKSCWRSRVVRLGDGSEQDGSLCEWPVLDMQKPVGKCMAIIKPVEVIRAIEACYEGGGVRCAPGALSARERDQLERLNASVTRASPYPEGRFAGRGVVICAGGPKYLTCAYVCIRMLHHVGCSLPIQVWHLGPAEMPEGWREIFEERRVELVDAHEAAAEHPCKSLNGWELKCYALIHSRFAEALLLDADNVPVADPEYLFNAREYRETGAIFWPDRGIVPLDNLIWRICGIEPRDEPAFESGQMVIDKSRCWKALGVAMHLNEWSDFYYRYIHGDKETFHLAWRKVGRPYTMAPPAQDQDWQALYQHDFAGRKIFQHRGGCKWTLSGENLRIDGFAYHDQCIGFLRELRARLHRS